MTEQLQPDPQREPPTAPRPARLAYGPAALVLCVWLVVAVLVLRFPVQPGALGMALLAAGALVAWRPLLLWWLVPAALPLLDLAPWSGRLFLDEFDLLLAVLVSAAWLRCPPATRRLPADRWLGAALALLVLSLLLSTLRALLPWTAPEGDAFNNLLSPFSALRLLRGAAWALLLWALARRHRAAGLDVLSAFGHGTVVGLLGTVLFIIGERSAFTELFDVSHAYRVAGPFSVMNLGGAYVEGYLVSALPFLLMRLLPPLPRWRLVGNGLLLVGTVYAVMVTFSRSGYAAFLIGLGVVLLWLLAWGAGRREGLALRRGPGRAAALVLAAVVCAVAWPVWMGAYAQSRFAAVDRDLVTRETHWVESLALIDKGPVALLLGMGLGRYPALNLLQSAPADRSASYRLTQEDGQPVLRLGNGQPIYLEQIVATQPGQTYQLQVRLRSRSAQSSLSVQLCEKWLISSDRCAHAVFSPKSGLGEWQTLTLPLASGRVGEPGPRVDRQVKLGFSLRGPTTLDVAMLSLRSADGLELLQNGGFAQGLDRWFFTSDHHLAWHAKSLPLAVLFDQGLLGVLALGGLLLLALGRAGRTAWTGHASAVPLLAALAGLCAVGAVDSLIDVPRFLMLWLLLCCFAAGGIGREPGRDQPG